MRVTRHNARGLKNSKTGYSAYHNDRNYDVEKCDNIDVEKMKDDRFLSIKSGGWYGIEDRFKHPSFAEVEEDYYKRHFKKQFDATMDGYRKKGNHGRIKNFDDWRKSKRYCPEETCIQIGNIDSHATKEQLFSVCMEYIKAELKFAKEHGNCFTILDIAFHFDESVPHMQMRKVWKSVDRETGIEMIGQNRALEQAASIDKNFVLPDPKAAIGKNNNYKMTYDKIMREKYLDICEEHGIEIEREPERAVIHDRSKNKLIADKVRDGKAVEQRIEKETAKLKGLQEEIRNLQEELQREYKKRQEEIDKFTEEQTLSNAKQIVERRKIQQKRVEKAQQFLDIPNDKDDNVYHKRTHHPSRGRSGKISPTEQHSI